MLVRQIAVFHALIGLVCSHSWVERLMVIGTNGTMIGNPGYIRGAVSRLDPNFNDFKMQHLLPTIPEGLLTDKLCKNTQRNRTYTTDLPALQAAPGAFIALQYQENGHVTLPGLTPQKKNSGTVYVYGTLYPRDDELLSSIHNVWNTDGTGGDGRGRLLAVRNFDDGQCYQINTGPLSMQRQAKFHKTAMNPQGADLWCQNDIRLPVSIPFSWYTLYWVWDWPSSPSDHLPGGESEIYTSCMDIEIQPRVQLDEMNFVDGQDLNMAGIKEQLE
ncbi:hypothetical protein VCV18_004869 [Metarhizium anisopliae]